MAQPRSKRELPAQLGQSDAYLNYKRHIVQGLINMTTPDKSQSCLQRYRFTAQVRSLLRSTPPTDQHPTPQ